MTIRMILLIAVALSACTRPNAPESKAAVTFEAVHGAGTVSTTLGRTPEKLQSIPVDVRIEPAGDIESVQASVDMPGMPMNVAPVTLEPVSPGHWRGELVFTMSGPWYIDIAADDGAETWSVRHDGISVP